MATPRSRTFLALAPLALLLAACGDHRAARVQPRAEQDFATLREQWNGSDLDGFVAHVDATNYLSNRGDTAKGLTDLREQLGPILQTAEPLIDSKPTDPRAYAVAHLVFAAENGAGKLSLVYDSELKLVGFHVGGQAIGAAPR